MISKITKIQKIILIICLIMMPIILFAKMDDSEFSIGTALVMESFISIHMSVFVLIPLSNIFSNENSKKTFWTLFIIRACFLIFCDLFVTTYIALIDFFAVFIGAFIVVPICAFITKKDIYSNNKVKKVNIRPNIEVNGIELKCANCSSSLKITDKFCPNCGEPFEGNNVVVSEKANAKIQIPPKTTIFQNESNKNLIKGRMLNEIIDKELKKANLDNSTELIPNNLLERKKKLSITFSILVFIYTALIFFHLPTNTYIIGIILLLILYKLIHDCNLIKYLKKQLKNKSKEKISDFIIKTKKKLKIDNSKELLKNYTLIALILPLILFATPKIIYKKTDNSYAVRYYVYGLTNFKTVSIPETHNKKKVVSIEKNAFSNMSFLEKVTLPDTITKIEGYAFKNCKNLSKINIPKNLKYLGNGSFSNASSIKNIELPDTLTYLGSSAFHGAKSLESIKLPNYIYEIKENTFNNCTSLKSIIIPDSVLRIGINAFYGASSLSEVGITEKSNLEEISSSAFRQCSNLRTISIPNYVNVSEQAFSESPTTINYFSSFYNENSKIIENDNPRDIVIPYFSDYILFENDDKVLEINSYNLKLDYITGILDNGYYNDAYISGAVYNPTYLSGYINMIIHFYDRNHNELASHQKEIELLGEGYSAISFYCGTNINKLPKGKTFDDIYYYKIEISQVHIE